MRIFQNLNILDVKIIFKRDDKYEKLTKYCHTSSIVKLSYFYI